MNKLALMLAAILLVSGCGQGIIRGNAKLYEIDIKKIPILSSKQAFHLVNAFDAPRIVELSDNEDTRGDLKQLTDTCIELLASALEKRSIKVTHQGKPITLHVHHIETYAGYWVRRTSLRLDAKLDNGKLVAVAADYRSPGDSFRAINGTLRKAVVNLLNHEDIIQYINSGSIN
ncbi:MAG: hypothetical protein OEZ68_15055 [Gammaproteobacteria bacterium]|nr:hypothetical protein [Gammaproteobacteria bacterium]MDH5802118.1 hypothetical protein [Gammaproteobacteria bacterium]